MAERKVAKSVVLMAVQKADGMVDKRVALRAALMVE